MKKLLFSLVVMALVAPAMAVVDFDITDGGNGEETVARRPVTVQPPS